jgi:hypothetical protein
MGIVYIDDGIRSCPGGHDLNLCFAVSLSHGRNYILERWNRAAWELQNNWVRRYWVSSQCKQGDTRSPKAKTDLVSLEWMIWEGVGAQYRESSGVKGRMGQRAKYWSWRNDLGGGLWRALEVHHESARCGPRAKVILRFRFPCLEGSQRGIRWQAKVFSKPNP